MRQKKQIELNLGTGARGEAPKAAAQATEARAAKASLERPAVAGPLMEAVVERENLKEALARVKRNKGAAGVDGMTVGDLPAYLKEHWLTIRAQLLDGTYKPQPVRRVEIPKASGGLRPLGIPTVLDRLIQQAVMQVLQADWDGTFSETSFGFRPKRSAHQAVEQAQAYIASDHGFVVDIDLEKFFDRVNHDILMGLVAKRVADKRLLKLIRGFLTAGVLEGGLVSATEEGTPQGGPLSPLLSNLMLDVLDKELEKRGHRFVRYADDCNIYVRSQKAGEAGIERFLEKRLKAQGQQGQERGRQAERPQVPGLQLHRREGAATAHCAAGARSLQSESPGADTTHVRTKPRTDRQGAVHLPCRLARIFRLLPNPVGVERTRSVDQAAVARHRLEAVEAWSHPLCRTATPWRRPGSGGSNRRQPTWPLAVGGEPCA
ncbi:retron-type reverse transcriptase [Bradyrhizobium sp. LM2.7]